MYRKIVLAVIAATAIGTAALAPTSASAWWGHGGWGHGGWGHYGGWGYRGWGGPAYIVAPGYSYGYGRGWCYWHPYRCGRW